MFWGFFFCVKPVKKFNLWDQQKKKLYIFLSIMSNSFFHSVSHMTFFILFFSQKKFQVFTEWKKEKKLE